MESQVTVVVLTKNEASQMESLLQNVAKLTPHVLVVDSGSTDDTVALAEAGGATVVYRAWDNDFSAQRNFALEHVKTHWVLYLDADERLTPDAIASIESMTVEGAQEAAYTLKRHAVLFGKELRHGAMRPDRVARLFPTDKVHWVNKVHERPETDLPVKPLAGYAEHYTYSSWEQYWSKFNQYTTIWAEDAYRRNKKVSWFSAFSHATLGLFKVTILNGGFLDGWLGLIMCWNHYMYTLMKYAKLMELYRKGSLKND